MQKIIGFTQLRNELELGNLENFHRSMSQICDSVYVYDQGSSKENIDFYKKAGWSVIEGKFNNIFNEQECKRVLLEKLLLENPDCDWIFWMDGDTILDGRFTSEIAGILCSVGGAGAYTFGHYNLWRSDTWYRTDNAFHALHGGRCALWRVVPGMKFTPNSGLHKNPVPDGVVNHKPSGYNLIHRGFSTDLQILNRYFERYQIYLSNKQSPLILNRLFDESTLSCEPLPDGILPEWFDVVQPNHPSTLTPMKDLYRDRLESNIGSDWETFKAKFGHKWKLG